MKDYCYSVYGLFLSLRCSLSTVMTDDCWLVEYHERLLNLFISSNSLVFLNSERFSTYIITLSNILILTSESEYLSACFTLKHFQIKIIIIYSDHILCPLSYNPASHLLTHTTRSLSLSQNKHLSLTPTTQAHQKGENLLLSVHCSVVGLCANYHFLQEDYCLMRAE